VYRLLVLRTVALICFRYLITDNAAGVEHLQSRIELHRLDNIAAEHAHPERKRRHGDHLATATRYLDNLNINKQTRLS